MEPKFQSSFIPKGPIGSSADVEVGSTRGEHSLWGFIATIIFILAALSAVGAFGYKFYLNYSIGNMKAELEERRAEVETETVNEITRLNNRLLATESLVDTHIVLSPLFRFIDANTLKNVRFTEVSYETQELEGGVVLMLRGEARGYSALASQADLFNKNPDFIDPVFSNLRLDEKGNVGFSFEAKINPNLLSYRKEVERLGTTGPISSPSATSTATTTASTTPMRTSTTTQSQATSTRN